MSASLCDAYAVLKFSALLSAKRSRCVDPRQFSCRLVTSSGCCAGRGVNERQIANSLIDRRLRRFTGQPETGVIGRSKNA
jgi:hypothetical protein